MILIHLNKEHGFNSGHCRMTNCMTISHLNDNLLLKVIKQFANYKFRSQATYIENELSTDLYVNLFT